MVKKQFIYDNVFTEGVNLYEEIPYRFGAIKEMDWTNV